MSYNQFHPAHTTRPNPTSHQTNHNPNSYTYYQPNFQKTQNYKTSDHTTNLNTPSINSNYLNVNSKFNQQKISPFPAQRKHDAWKSSENTSRSMVFMGNQTQTVPLFPAKKKFAGLGKLSQMARTVTNHSDDNDEIDTHKYTNQTVTSNNSNYKDTFSSKTYGNYLAPDSGNLRNNYEKTPSTASSMIFNPNEQRTNVYKSFINYGSNNNSGPDAKSNVNLDFLLKFKKQQEEKKHRQMNSLKVIDQKRHQVTKSNDNGHRNLLCPPQNNHHQLFHQYSAPKLGHGQKSHHYEPVVIHNLPKTEEKAHKFHNQIDSPYSKNSQHLHTYTPNHPFIKKLYPEKLDRYVPQKTFNSESQLPSKEGSSPVPKGLAFAKKQTQVAVQSATSTSQNTPIKDKFVSATFFKHRQNKLFSETKTVQTTPSPSSVKGKQFFEGQSPKHVKSTISEDGSSRSVEYIDSDASSEEQKQWTLRDFQLGDKLGKGAFGDVYIAREINLGFMCVLKKMSKKRIKDLQREQHVIRQLKIQMYLNHKHLTAMYGYFHDNENIYLILEYLPDGNLSQIKKRKKTSQKQTAGILKQLCEGLSFMHKQNIIHRDIKPQNIFLNEGNMKLGDFGCSVFTDAMRRTVVSCLEYSSPEQLNGECYNQKIDVWGIGILAYQLLTGRSPYEKEIMNMGCQQIDFSALKFPEQLKLSALAKDFIMALLNVDPIDRIDIEEALEHKFITSNYQPSVILSLE